MRGVIMFRKTKGNKSRAAFMTAAVKAILEARTKGARALVFPGRNGVEIEQASDAFIRAVDKLRFNEGIADREQRVVFHTLRHAFASWLVETGADIYYVMKLMGHSDIKLTMRYAHIGKKFIADGGERLEAIG